MSKIKFYLQIVKPGIIFGNFISIIGGFLLASKGQINYLLFFYTLVGVSLVIASACVLNNVIDLDIDKKMERTQTRIIVQGLISKNNSLLYAIIICIIGCAVLYIFVNTLSLWIAIIGFIIYVVIYSLYMKRNSIYSTLIGSISGATPPVIGYCAVNNKLDYGAIILFFIFCLWQMPHSYAISIFHYKDYQAASIPVLPVKCGIMVTKHHIILYIIGFMLSTMMLTMNGYTGYKYFSLSILVNLGWLSLALQGYRFKSITNNIIWAKKLFIYSIVVLTFISMMMSVDYTV